MPYSLLNNSRLKNSSSVRFTLLFIGFCILLASVAVWVGIADYDYRYSFGEQQQADELSIQQQTEAVPYNQLTAEKQRTVNQAIDGRTFNFEDEPIQLPELVSRENTYYKFDFSRTFDWTNPTTFGPILLGIVGLWLMWETIQHERMSY